MIGKSDEANPTIFPRARDLVQGETCQWHGMSGATMHSTRCSLPQFGIAMMLVVESLKGARFLAQMGRAGKSLSTKEALVVGVIEPFDDAITPRFSFGDKDDLDTSVEAEANHQAEAARVSVGASEGELVINLQKPRHTKALPLSKKSLADGLCLLSFKDFQGHGIAIGIDEMAAVKANTAGEVTRPDKVQLLQCTRMNNRELGICWPGTSTWVFSPQLVPMDNAVNGPDFR